MGMDPDENNVYSTNVSHPPESGSWCALCNCAYLYDRATVTHKYIGDEE